MKAAPAATPRPAPDTAATEPQHTGVGPAVPTSAGAPIGSPCNAVCTIDPATGWCRGCGRTIDEIMAWPSLSEGARRAVWQTLAARGGPALP